MFYHLFFTSYGDTRDICVLVTVVLLPFITILICHFLLPFFVVSCTPFLMLSALCSCALGFGAEIHDLPLKLLCWEERWGDLMGIARRILIPLSPLC